MPPPRPALLILATILALTGCQRSAPPPRSLVGDFPVPAAYALAGDNITVWKHVRQADGAWRFHSYSITSGGAVEYLETRDTGDAADDVEQTAADLAERRKSFLLPQGEFEEIRGRAALLRPATLGPRDPVGGYGGEALPAGCSHGAVQSRMAGVNFLNGVNWGTFTLPAGCDSANARAAAAVMTDLFDRLDRAAQRDAQASR